MIKEAAMKIKFISIGTLIAAFLIILTAFNFLSFNASAQTLIESDGLKYTLQENGDMVLYTGWTKKSDKRFYYINGEKLKNKWLVSKGIKKSYLTADGSAATGKVTLFGTEYEFDDKGRLVQDNWNVKIEASDISATDCTFTITINDLSFYGEYTYGRAYTIERYSKNTWQPMPIINDDIEFTEEEIWLDAGVQSERYGWEDLYGKLPKGRYRICKAIGKYSKQYSRERENKKYYAYFTID